MSNEPNSGGEESSDEPNPDDIELDDPKGRWDNRLAYLIASSPVIIILLLAGGAFVMVVTGAIELNFTVSGELPIETVWNTVIAPAALFLLLAFGFIWLLSVMSWFGASGVVKVGRVIEQAIRDYGNGGNNE
jgi:hypothetical protein